MNTMVMQGVADRDQAEHETAMDQASIADMLKDRDGNPAAKSKRKPMKLRDRLDAAYRAMAQAQS